MTSKVKADKVAETFQTDDFYNGHKHEIAGDEGYSQYKIHGMPSCCGIAIVHYFEPEIIDLNLMTTELIKILEINQREGMGVGSFLAVTSERQASIEEYFQDHANWTEAATTTNYGSGNRLKTWILTL